MSQPLLTRCAVCVHFSGFEGIHEDDEPVAQGFRPMCAAFPKGIPHKVYLWKEPHTEVRKRQTGDYVFQEDAAKAKANPGIAEIL